MELLKVEEMRDPHAIAGLLKQYLRDLPSSILTPTLHMQCVGVMSEFCDRSYGAELIFPVEYDDPKDRTGALARLISQLPFANYSLLRALTAHLILIVQNASINKMSIRNVGIVFSPTLGFPAPLFNLMLSDFNKVFNVDGADGESDDEDDAASEQPTEQPHDSPVSKRLSVHSRRNSRNYQEGAVDQLLGLHGRSLDGGEFFSNVTAGIVFLKQHVLQSQFPKISSPMEKMMDLLGGMTAKPRRMGLRRISRGPLIPIQFPTTTPRPAHLRLLT